MPKPNTECSPTPFSYHTFNKTKFKAYNITIQTTLATEIPSPYYCGRVPFPCHIA